MSPRTRWSILAFALAGLGLAAMSSWVHYRVLVDPTYVSPCDINATFSCTEVYLSRFGSVAGVPVALGGLFWFGLVALVAGFARPDASDRKSVAAAYLFGLSVLGLGVVLYLGYASFFVLKTGCVLCLGTYVCVTAIFLLSSFTSAESMTRLPARLVADLGGLLSRPVTLAAALLFLGGAVSLVAFFPKEGSKAAHLAQAASAPVAAPSASQQLTFEQAWAQQPRIDLGIKPDGAKVVIVKFNDYECGACAQAENFYKPTFDRFSKEHPGALKYVMKDWPWNKSCNFNIASTIQGHEAACDAAVAARVARDRNKYEEMAAWLFTHQGTTSAVLRGEAARILGPLDFDKEYAAKLPDIRRDIADGGVLRVESTPTYFINGVRLPPGIVPLDLLTLALNIELKRP